MVTTTRACRGLVNTGIANPAQPQHRACSTSAPSTPASPTGNGQTPASYNTGSQIPEAWQTPETTARGAFITGSDEQTACSRRSAEPAGGQLHHLSSDSPRPHRRHPGQHPHHRRHQLMFPSPPLWPSESTLRKRRHRYPQWHRLGPGRSDHCTAGTRRPRWTHLSKLTGPRRRSPNIGSFDLVPRDAVRRRRGPISHSDHRLLAGARQRATTGPSAGFLNWVHRRNFGNNPGLCCH